MKAPVRFRECALTVYALELCFYGEKGDYEVFADRELALDLEPLGDDLAGRGWVIEERGRELLMFRDDAGTEYTLYPDGRLIVEGLIPGSVEQAWSRACEIMGFKAVS